MLYQLTKVSACTLAENKPCLDNRREQTFSFGELVKWHATSLVSLVTGSIFTKRPAWHHIRYTRKWSTTNQRQPEHCSRTSNIVMARQALPNRVGIQWQRPCLLARACVLHHPDLHIFPTQPLASHPSFTDCEHLNAVPAIAERVQRLRQCQPLRAPLAKEFMQRLRWQQHLRQLVRSKYTDCGGRSFCEHQRLTSKCEDCRNVKVTTAVKKKGRKG